MFAQERQAKYYDEHHKDAVQLKVGLMVMLKAAGIIWAADKGRPPALSARWLGPFKIIDHLPGEEDWTTLNFRLEIPTSMENIHPVFLRSKLVLYHEPLQYFRDRTVFERPVPRVDPDSEVGVYEIDTILNKRIKNKTVQYLVKWRGYADHEADWLPYTKGEKNWEEDEDKVEEYEEWLSSVRTTRYGKQPRGGVARYEAVSSITMSP